MNRIPGDLLGLLGTPSALVGAADGRPAGSADGKDALVRPEGLRLTASPHGNGIVTTRTFLGQLTRLSVRLSGDVVVQVDQRTTDAAGISAGDSVQVSLSDSPVLLAERSASRGGGPPGPPIAAARRGSRR